LSRPIYPAGRPIIPPGDFPPYPLPTNYMYPGDATTGPGWIDGFDNTAGGRRFIATHGPFALSLHDTAEVVIALVDGMGADNLWSLRILKYNVGFAQYGYRGLVQPSVATGIVTPELPRSFEVSQNYPNPFNPSTTIRYQIPTTSRVVIKVYNLLGQNTATIVNGLRNAGVYTAEWNASNVPSGVYFYQTEVTPLSGKASLFREVKKMLLLK
jgi:hypothetical protein